MTLVHINLLARNKFIQLVLALISCCLCFSTTSMANTANGFRTQKLIPKPVFENAIHKISKACPYAREYKLFLELEEITRKKSISANEIYLLTKTKYTPPAIKITLLNNFEQRRDCHIAFVNFRESVHTYLKDFFTDPNAAKLIQEDIKLRKEIYLLASKNKVFSQKNIDNILFSFDKTQDTNQSNNRLNNTKKTQSLKIIDLIQGLESYEGLVQLPYFYETESIYFLLNINTLMNAACKKYITPRTIHYFNKPDLQIAMCERSKKQTEILSFILNIEDKTQQQLKQRLKDIDKFESNWHIKAENLKKHYAVLKPSGRNNYSSIDNFTSRIARLNNVLKAYIYAKLDDTKKLTELYPRVVYQLTPANYLKSQACISRAISVIPSIEETLLQNKNTYTELKKKICDFNPKEYALAVQLSKYPFSEDIQTIESYCKKVSEISLYSNLQKAKNNPLTPIKKFAWLATESTIMLEVARIVKPNYSRICEIKVIKTYEKLGNYFLEVMPEENNDRRDVLKSLANLTDYKKLKGF